MTEQSLREFFESGRLHVEYLMQTIHRYTDPNFAPRTVLDFGCGVGRTLPSFAAVAQEVVGLDVSPTMLQEARRNCDEHGATTVRLLLSDDSLSLLAGSFDLVHSCITFQHIPSERGRAIFSRLLNYLSPGGVGALHMTYSKSRFADTHGVAPTETASPDAAPTPVSAAAVPEADPEMQMNPYNLNQIAFSLQRNGVPRFHADFTDHGGELGVFLFFQKPADSV